MKINTKSWYIRKKKNVKKHIYIFGDCFDKFINKQVKSGKLTSASEIIRAALRLFKYEDTQKTELINELKKGEKSSFVKKFNRDSFLKKIHQKHLDKA